MSKIGFAPDPPPRDTAYHRQITSSKQLGEFKSAHELTLDCGHQMIMFGDLAHLEGRAYCSACVKGLKERNAP